VIFWAHAEPVVRLGRNEWIFVILSSAIILTIMGPQLLQKLRSGD